MGILDSMFAAVPHPEFRGKLPLLYEMLEETKADRHAHPKDVPLADYEEKIRTKIDQLENETCPPVFDLIAEYLAKKAAEIDPLFGKENELEDLDFLAAWFKKLVDMAQPEPLTKVYDGCLARILKAIQDY